MWAGSSFYIGRQIETSLGEYENLISRSGDLLIHQLDYEPGLLYGKLHYDLEIQPAGDSELAAVAVAMQQLTGISLRTTGITDVRHGPFVGGAEPFALARLELPFELPDDLRDRLPQYPGDRPILTVNSVLGFDGTLLNSLTAVDYEGTLMVADETADFGLSGLTGSVEIDGRLDSTRVIFALGTLRLGPEPIAVVLENLQVEVRIDGEAPDLQVDVDLGRLQGLAAQTSSRFELENLVGHWDTTQLRPSVWVGDGTLNLDRIALAGNGFSAELLDFQGTSLASIDGAGRYQASSESLVSRINLGTDVVNNVVLNASVRGLNVDAYSRLISIASGTDPGPANQDDVLEAVLEAVNELLADQPVVSLDRLAMSISDADDINLSSSLTYSGPAIDNLLQPQALLNGLEVQGNIYLAAPAARRLIEIGLGMADPSLQGIALDNAVDANYRQLLTSLQDANLATVTGDGITASLQVADGVVAVNGSVLTTVDDLMPRVAIPQPGTPSALGPVVMQPEFLTDPRFERVSLVTGFAPDPHTIELLASGQRLAMDVLGANCAGSVNSPVPDITLNYTSGSDYGLYLYAESDSDTTLVVLTPQGWECDDDSHGDFNPGVSIDNPSSGNYMIWVGTFAEGTAQAILGISEF